MFIISGLKKKKNTTHTHTTKQKTTSIHINLLYNRIEFREVLLADYAQDSTLACLSGKTTILGDLLAGILPSNGMICNLTHTQQQQCPAGDEYQECKHRRFCQGTWDTQRQFIYLSALNPHFRHHPWRPKCNDYKSFTGQCLQTQNYITR